MAAADLGWGGSSSTPSPQSTLGYGAGQQAPIDPRTLNALGQNISQTDPGLAGGVADVLKTPMSVVGNVLNAIGAPGRDIRNYLFGTTDAEQWLAQRVKGNGLLPSLERAIGGFALNAATDPVTYLTAGTGGIAKSAAEQTLLRTGLETAADSGLLDRAGLDAATAEAAKGGQPLVSWAATHESPFVRDFAAATQGQASYARSLQNAENLLPGITKQLPDEVSGGIRLHVPFTHGPQLTLVPSSITGKLAAPIGEFLKEGVVPDALKSLPGIDAAASGTSNLYDQLASRFSRSWDALHGAREADVAKNGAEGVAGPAGSGLGGRLTTATRQAAQRAFANAKDEVGQMVNGLAHAFGPDETGQQLFRTAVESPEQLTQELTAAQKSALEKYQTWRTGILGRANAAGIETGDLGPGYIPRVPTDEAAALTRGTPEAQNALGDIHYASNPGSSFSRGANPPFEEAQAAKSAELSAKAGKEITAYETDPYKSILKSARNTNGAIMGREIANGLQKADLLWSTIDKTSTGVSKAELDKLGVTPTAARQAFMEGSHQPWMDQLSPETRAGLAEEADIARSKSNAYLPSLSAEEAGAKSRLSTLSTSMMHKGDLADVKVQDFWDHLQGLQDRMDNLDQWTQEATAARQNAYNRFFSGSDKLDSLNTQYETHRLPSGNLTQKAGASAERKLLRESMAKVTADMNQALADFRDTHGQVTGFQDAQADIEKQYRQAYQHPTAQAAQQAIDSQAATHSAMEKQLDRLDQLGLKRTNLEAGLRPGGQDWPIIMDNGVVPEGWRPITDPVFNYFQGKTAPAYVADEIENAMKMAHSDDLLKSYQKFTQFYKKMVTVPMPHFWMKRALAGWFVNAMGGVGMDSELAGHALVQAMQDGLPDETQIGSKTLGEYKNALVGQRVLNHSLGETQQDLLGLGHSSNNPLMKAGTAVLQKIDDTARAAAFIHAYDQLGDAEAARMFTLQRHGDYGELTQFEKKFVGNTLPFYKWLKVKTPLLIQNLVENPGFVVNSNRFQQDVLGNPAATAAAYADGYMPFNTAQKGGFIAGPLLQPLMNALGAHGQQVAVSTDLPTFSLNSLTGLSNAMGDLNPIFQTLIGMGTNTQIYPGQIEPLKMTTNVKGVYGAAARVMERIPLLSGLVTRTPGGDIRMNSKAYELLNQLPTSAIASGLGTVAGATGGDATAVAKTFTPFAATTLTPQEEQGALAGQKAALNNLITELYRRGESTQFKQNESTPFKTKSKVLGY